MKRLLSLALVITSLFALIACQSVEASAEDARITMDINPSVEIITNAEGKVEMVSPLNEAAEGLLLDVDLKGKTAIEAILEITDLATTYGYIDANAENALVIRTEMENEADMTELQTQLRNQVKAHLESKNIEAEVVDGNQAVAQVDIDMANELGITVGKYLIIKAAMQVNVELTYEQAIEMSVRDLLSEVRTGRAETSQFISDHARFAYLQLKANGLATFHYMKTNFIYAQAQLALTTDATVFDDVLVDSDLDATAAVALYGEYVAAIEAIEAPDPTPYEVSIQTKVDADANIQLLEETLVTLKAELQAQYQQFQGQGDHEALKAEAKATLEAYLQAKADLRAAVEVYVVAEELPYDYVFFYRNGEIHIIFLSNYMTEFRTVRETYRQLFLEHNIELQSFEALFLGNIGTYLQMTLNQYNQVMNQFKLQMNALNAEAQLQIRYEHTIRYESHNQG